jgi:hypothetical protein
MFHMVDNQVTSPKDTNLKDTNHKGISPKGTLLQEDMGSQLQHSQQVGGPQELLVSSFFEYYVFK